jgi:hypothetical protein
MQWIFICLLGFFGFGIGRAIKLLAINKDNREYAGNLKFPSLGLAITFFVGGLLHKFAHMPAPLDDWKTWAIIAGPFVLALIFGNSDTLNTGR